MAPEADKTIIVSGKYKVWPFISLLGYWLLFVTLNQ